MEQFIPEIEIDRGEPEATDGPAETLGVATYIGISGDLEGRVIYEMDRVTAVNIASEMNGEDIPGLNELVRETIQELSNIISGNASQELDAMEDGLRITITPPSTIIGESAEIYDSVSSGFIRLPLETNLGEFTINLAVSRADNE